MVFKTDYCLIQVKSIGECSKRAWDHSAILSNTKLPFYLKTFVLSIFEWPLKTGFTVCELVCMCVNPCHAGTSFS